MENRAVGQVMKVITITQFTTDRVKMKQKSNERNQLSNSKHTIKQYRFRNPAVILFPSLSGLIVTIIMITRMSGAFILT